MNLRVFGCSMRASEPTSFSFFREFSESPSILKSSKTIMDSPEVSTIKRLIVNADDFGLHEKIYDGILKGYLEGCITNTSIVVGGKAFRHGVALAQGYPYPGLSVGAHLTLVGVAPVARNNVDSLTNGYGNLLPDYRTFIRGYLSGRIAPQHIETELRCQLQKAIDSGVKISHLDSHQHLHVLPGIVKIVIRLAREFNISKIRIPAEALWFFNTRHWSIARVLNRVGLTSCAMWSKHCYQTAEMVSPARFFGMFLAERQIQLISYRNL